MTQERVFMDGEGDAWFRRNPLVESAAADDPVLALLTRVPVAETGRLLDVGGSTGRVAAGFVAQHGGWNADVVDPSPEALSAGGEAFPHLSFRRGTADSLVGNPFYDLVIVSFVLCVVERSNLARAIAGIDGSLRNGGLLVVADFDPAEPRKNPYIHSPGLYTYKQDYAAAFTALGTYSVVERDRIQHGTGANPHDPTDTRCFVAALRKDLSGLYVGT